MTRKAKVKNHNGINNAKFVNGSIIHHIIVMTSTGAIGLIAIFIIDLFNMFYISMLGAQKLAAAVGYAGTIVFFTNSVSIAMSIAAGVAISRPIGNKNYSKASQLASSSYYLSAITSLLLIIAIYPFINQLLSLIGASGETAAIAAGYLRISLPSLPFISIAMSCAGVMRAYGDAKRSMLIPLTSGIIAGILDPIFILLLDLEVPGAAIVTVIARFGSAFVGTYCVIYIHDILRKPSFNKILPDSLTLGYIAIPAIFANLALPFSNSYATRIIAQFGDSAVAGFAIIGRIMPVAFCVIFALSGAISPIIGQNYGAMAMDRVRLVVRDTIIFIAIYSAITAILLWLAQAELIQMFNADAQTSVLIVFFTSYSFLFCFFVGMLFTANAVFNTLGYPILTTVFNWARSTLGTIPFVTFGAYYAGSVGIIGGQIAGTICFGIVAILVAQYIVVRISDKKQISTSQNTENILNIESNSNNYTMTAKSACAEVLMEEYTKSAIDGNQAETDHNISLRLNPDGNSQQNQTKPPLTTAKTN